MKGYPVNMSGSGIGLSTWKITACWQVNSAAKKRIREGANPPCRESSRHLAQIFSRFLPVAHRGWMNPSRQLLHSCRLRRCKRAHRSVAAGDVVADRGQTLQNRLPLFPVQLPQERPQPLDEWILQQCLAVRFGHEEAVQADAKRFGNFFQRSEAGRHLAAFDPRQIRPGNPRARLELALRHPARFAQLPDTLPYILHRLAVRPLLEELPVVARKLLRLRWRNQKLHLRRQQAQAPAAIPRAGAILHEPAGLTTNYFAVEVQVHSNLVPVRTVHTIRLFRHRCSSQTIPACG